MRRFSGNQKPQTTNRIQQILTHIELFFPQSSSERAFDCWHLPLLNWQETFPFASHSHFVEYREVVLSSTLHSKHYEKMQTRSRNTVASSVLSFSPVPSLLSQTSHSKASAQGQTGDHPKRKPGRPRKTLSTTGTLATPSPPSRGKGKGIHLPTPSPTPGRSNASHSQTPIPSPSPPEKLRHKAVHARIVPSSTSGGHTKKRRASSPPPAPDGSENVQRTPPTHLPSPPHSAELQNSATGPASQRLRQTSSDTVQPSKKRKINQPKPAIQAPKLSKVKKSVRFSPDQLEDDGEKNFEEQQFAMVDPGESEVDPDGLQGVGIRPSPEIEQDIQHAYEDEAANDHHLLDDADSAFLDNQETLLEEDHSLETLFEHQNYIDTVVSQNEACRKDLDELKARTKQFCRNYFEVPQSEMSEDDLLQLWSHQEFLEYMNYVAARGSYVQIFPLFCHSSFPLLRLFSPIARDNIDLTYVLINQTLMVPYPGTPSSQPNLWHYRQDSLYSCLWP